MITEAEREATRNFYNSLQLSMDRVGQMIQNDQAYYVINSEEGMRHFDNICSGFCSAALAGIGLAHNNIMQMQYDAATIGDLVSQSMTLVIRIGTLRGIQVKQGGSIQNFIDAFYHVIESYDSLQRLLALYGDEMLKAKVDVKIFRFEAGKSL